MKRDYLTIIEAAYAQVESDREWFQGIADAARPVIDAGMGVCVYSYDASDPSRLKLDNFADSGSPEGWREAAQQAVMMLPPEAVKVFYGGDPPAALLSTLQRKIPLPPAGTQRLAEFGMHDAIGIRGHDPSGHGLLLTATGLGPMRLAPKAKAALDRVAAHLASAWRLRRAAPGAARPEDAEAILEPSGKVAHATEPLRNKRSLAPLVEALERRASMTSTRKLDPESALELWRALVAGRWSLIEHEERGGRRYILACKNGPEVAAPQALSPLERAAIAYASWGHSNKLIAYELGIAPSTVSRLLSTALRKLGLRSPAELTRFFNPATGDDHAPR